MNTSATQVATALAEVVRNARNERGEVMDIAQYYYMYALEGKYALYYCHRVKSLLKILDKDNFY